MISIMILPVRPWMLDIFLTINLSAGAILLMSALLTPTGAKIFTFPAMLVLTTLFRLALDISSTRLILTEADAGQVIRSFGQFAAGGSLVVGLVVFLIITLVQLIVISKGAEQTSIATFHFVRDSIPGKQQAIETDVQQGRLSVDGLAQARAEMEIEVEFFSRMYGAMQFIKGDSVAGLVVAAINIVGGLITGVAVNHMAVGEALETYTLLTVGAGLVSQIPALVGSVAGTILVSRVTAGGAGEGLGETVSKQFSTLPKAMMLASVMLIGLGFVPGMPTLSFLVLGAGLGYTSYRLESRGDARAKKAEKGEAVEFAAVPGLELVSRTTGAGGSEVQTVRREATALIEDFAADTGIALPAWSFRTAQADPSLPAFEARRGGVLVATGSSWAELKPGITRNLLDYPATNFGLDQMGRWLQSVRKTTPMLGSSLIPVLQVKWAPPPNIGAPAGMGQQECLVKLYQMLKRMVEERIPINDSSAIADYFLNSENKPTGSAKDGRDTMINDLRERLRENSLRFYRKWYGDLASPILVIPESSGLDKELVKTTGDATKNVGARLQEILKGRGICMIAVHRDQRARLWEIAHQAFNRKELDRPVLALGFGELQLPKDSTQSTPPQESKEAGRADAEGLTRFTVVRIE